MSPVYLRVRELREAKGLTQAQLGEKAGIRAATISRIEGGRVSGVEFATLEKLARALDVDPALLIAKTPDKKR